MRNDRLRRSHAPAAALAAILTHLFSGSAASAQQAATLLDFRDAPFSAVIQAIADGTGQRFLIDPRIQTPLTMVSAGPLSPESMWGAFTSMLEIYSLEVRRVGRDLRISPVQPAEVGTSNAAARVVASSVGKSNLSAAATVVAEPLFANGLQRGLRVAPGTEPAEFDRLGLDRGDVLLAVNGTALDDAARSQQILDAALTSSSDVSVTVERAGQVQELILYTARL